MLSGRTARRQFRNILMPDNEIWYRMKIQFQIARAEKRE